MSLWKWRHKTISVFLTRLLKLIKMNSTSLSIWSPYHLSTVPCHGTLNHFLLMRTEFFTQRGSLREISFIVPALSFKKITEKTTKAMIFNGTLKLFHLNMNTRVKITPLLAFLIVTLKDKLRWKNITTHFLPSESTETCKNLIFISDWITTHEYDDILKITLLWSENEPWIVLKR